MFKDSNFQRTVLPSINILITVTAQTVAGRNRKSVHVYTEATFSSSNMSFQDIITKCILYPSYIKLLTAWGMAIVITFSTRKAKKLMYVLYGPQTIRHKNTKTFFEDKIKWLKSVAKERECTSRIYPFPAKTITCNYFSNSMVNTFWYQNLKDQVLKIVEVITHTGLHIGAIVANRNKG